MLTSEQERHFSKCFSRAMAIAFTPVDSPETREFLSFHIRVSSRKTCSNQCVIGFVFGAKGTQDWLAITTVTEDELVEIKKIYRGMLRDQMLC